MDTRDLWEEQVERLTKQLQLVIHQIDTFDQRVTFLENTVLTLIVALKSGGVIVDSSEGEFELT